MVGEGPTPGRTAVPNAERRVTALGNTRPVRKPGSRSAGVRTVRVALVASLALVVAATTSGTAAAAPGTATPVNGNGPRMPLVGSVAPVPSGAAVLGPTAPATRVTVDVALRPRDPAALAGYARAVSTPGDPRYRQYLPAGHLASTFGPTAAAVQATRDWLASTGLTVGSTTPDGLVVPATGTAGQLESAFAVPLVQARLTDGRTVRLATKDPSVPSTLVPVLQGVLGLSDQAIARPHLTAPVPLGTASAGPVHGAAAHAVGPQPCAAATATRPPGTVSPRTASDLASTYGLSSLFAGGRDGSGQTVGIFELEQYTPTDIATYQACYGTGVPVTDTPVDGGAGTPVQYGEAALDIEVVAGLAPGVSVHVYTGPNDGANGAFDTYQQMVTDDTAKVITTSWGQCESLLGSNTALSRQAQLAEQTLFQLAAVQGQTVVAASGDSGSSDCYPANGDPAVAVDDPSVQPFVTGVGGTVLSAIAADHPTEVAWGGAASSGGAGGGGNSVTFAAPAWQQVAAARSGLTAYNCGASGNLQCREVPDVSASADRAYGDVIFFNGIWYVFGGTSMASPLWAALVADVDQGCAAPAGYLDPTLYGSGAAGAFNDVGTGDNYLPSLPAGVTTAFPATTGYDMATGWGSPRAVALLGLLTGAASGCPTVTGLAPATGPAVGGTQVVISGSGFGSAAPGVAFGGTPATVLSHDPGGTSVTVVAPARAAGPAAVTVTSNSAAAGGTSPATAVSTYTYFAPVVTGVTPGKGPVSGGGTVVITGSRFDQVQSVTFGGRTATFRVDSSGVIAATVPAGAAGTVDVIVQAQSGSSSPSAQARYTYALPGYWMAASDGGIFAFGGAGFHGSAASLALGAPVVAVAPTSDDQGYWLVASDGGIFAFGDAPFYGSTGNLTLNRPIVGMAPTPDGRGYWLVASDGGIFAFGDAPFYGSTGNLTLNRPVVGMAAAPDGRGYWLVASDGGIFAFGDAPFFGSTGNLTLNRQVVGMAATTHGAGYWLVASDGGIFAFGDAPFFGSTGNLTLNRPVVGMAVDLTGTGYWLVASDGGIFAFGDAPFFGSTGNLTLNRPITGMAAT